jgi:hypothetical protein
MSPQLNPLVFCTWQMDKKGVHSYVKVVLKYGYLW